MMTLFHKVLSALLLVQGAVAFKIEVTGSYCQQRSISAEFTQFCNSNNTCSIGEQALVSGYVNMTSAVASSWGLDADSTVYLDSKIHISSYFQQQILDMKPVTLCNDTGLSVVESGDDDSNTNACPSAGIYIFNELPVFLPATSNRVFDWAATGWTGTATLDVYVDEDKYKLIGRCKIDIVTHSDSGSNNTFDGSSSNADVIDSVLQQVPEAKITAMIVLGTLAALTFLCCVCSYICCSSNTEDAFEEGTSFARMDLGESA